jgi:hypothetical protein
MEDKRPSTTRTKAGRTLRVRRAVLVTYVYVWKNNEKRKTMCGRECNVIARGSMNSIMIRFTDNGEKAIVSRHSVRIKRKVSV